ncbi:antitermination protein [Obesumbacterium proteus]|uniref:Phage antitermination protein Q n=1 Tax=Obesumbacterium proteus ATCC 12841 TaxID=1354268 RepID=A0AA91EEH1_9GAMM|nr:antitermination protein [Obesumbacterium proteus]AMO82089.1 antitermination protein [Obesumbacterium proteus]OAT56772.1 phage antitermination protein Q [Obesumbacterium proteus ATCC 12841]
MNIESTVKFHSPKSTQISDSPRATASDALTNTDVMCALGMVQSRAPLGFAAFNGKMNISENDKKRSVQLLTQYGLKHCDKVAALRKLDMNIKVKVVQTLAKFAYKDYCRSAAGTELCDCCKGARVIRSKTMVMKHAGCGKTPPKYAEEVTHTMCPKCNGKGEVSVACCKCNGRGEAVNREETERQGVPVKHTCKQCSGRGYERIPTTKAFRAVSVLAPTLTLDVWKRGAKPFYEELISHIEKEESFADSQLKKVTSRITES